jgi:hypothetical protein
MIKVNQCHCEQIIRLFRSCQKYILYTFSKKALCIHKCLIEIVPWTGFEPMTHSLEGCCSIQLSYQGIFIFKHFKGRYPT